MGEVMFEKCKERNDPALCISLSFNIVFRCFLSETLKISHQAVIGTLNTKSILTIALGGKTRQTGVFDEKQQKVCFSAEKWEYTFRNGCTFEAHTKQKRKP